MKNFIIVVLLLLFIYPLYGDVAKVTGDRVNVRIKPVLGSEIITQLSLGEEVEVLEKRNEWTKIKGPLHSRCWVHSDFVENGVITANKVNMRCGPGVAFPVLCKLKKDTRVNAIDVAGEWVRIDPPVEFGVWVSSKYIEYPEPGEAGAEEPARRKEKVIARREEKIVERKVDTEILPEIKPKPLIPIRETSNTISVPQEDVSGLTLISCAGVLEDLGVIINRPGTYKLLTNNKWICILKSPTLDLNPYVNRLVRIEGVVISKTSSWKVPVVEVKRLQVIK